MGDIIAGILAVVSITFMFCAYPTIKVIEYTGKNPDSAVAKMWRMLMGIFHKGKETKSTAQKPVEKRTDSRTGNVSNAAYDGTGDDNFARMLKAYDPQTEEFETDCLERQDIIVTDFKSAITFKGMEISLLTDGVAYDETEIVVNALDGKVSKRQNHVDDRFMSHYMYSDVTSQEVRKFARSISEEMGEKFKDFTCAGWQRYLFEDHQREQLEEIKNHIKTGGQAESMEVKFLPKAFHDIDCDAYYIATHRQFGSHMVFLRRTDSGWRAFIKSPGCFGLKNSKSHNISEEYVLKCLNNEMGEVYICADRKLNEKDLSYVTELMPKEHAYSRLLGMSRRRIPVNERLTEEIEAYYLKRGRWLPCADFADIDKIAERIGQVAKYEVNYRI